MTRLHRQSIFLVLIALLYFPSHAIAVSIVANGDFEAGGTGWTILSSGWNIAAFTRGVIGTQSAATGAPGPEAADFALISQVLTTTPGTYYDLTFYAYADGLAGGLYSTPNEIKVRWGGAWIVGNDSLDHLVVRWAA